MTDALIIGFVVLFALGVFGFIKLRPWLKTRETRRKPLGRMSLNPEDWDIGPIAMGKNKSIGMPPHPSRHPEGWYFEFPRAGSHVHYVTTDYGPLTGVKGIRMRYRVEAAPRVQIWPQTAAPPAPSMLTLFFQRRGDNWTAENEFETYRWWAAFASVYPILPGDHEIMVSMDENWSAVMTTYAHDNPAAFKDAIDNALCVGFVFGGGDGLGHGAYADGEARFILTHFELLR